MDFYVSGICSEYLKKKWKYATDKQREKKKTKNQCKREQTLFFSRGVHVCVLFVHHSTAEIHEKQKMKYNSKKNYTCSCGIDGHVPLRHLSPIH